MKKQLLTLFFILFFYAITFAMDRPIIVEGGFESDFKRVLLYTKDFPTSEQEIKDLNIGAKVTHKLSNQVFVVRVPPAIQLENYLNVTNSWSLVPYGPLDLTSESMIRAWETMSSESTNSNVTTLGSDCDKLLLFESPPKTGLIPGSTCTYMSGRIAIGIIIVENPTSTPRITFTEKDIQFIRSQILAATRLLEPAEPLANVSFDLSYEQRVSVTINPPTYPGPTDQNRYETMEQPWRDAALNQLVGSVGDEGANALVAHIISRSTPRANYGCLAFFTPYPLAWAGYARLPQRFVAGPNYHDRIGNLRHGWSGVGTFAHETCHLFGAADEYNQTETGGQRCSGDPSGTNQVPNSNCVNCTTDQLTCLMQDASPRGLSLCNYSRGQLGWPWWRDSKTILDQHTSGDIAVTVFKGRMYALWNTNGNSTSAFQYAVTDNGNTWHLAKNHSASVFSTPQGVRGLAAAEFKDKLYVLWQSPSYDHLYGITFDGNKWGNPYSFMQRTKGGLALATFQDKLYALWQSDENISPPLHYAYKRDGEEGWIPADSSHSNGSSKVRGLAATEFRGKLYALWQANNYSNAICYASFNGKKWGKTGNIRAQVTKGGIAVTIFSGRLYALWQGNNTISCASSADGENWNIGADIPWQITRGGLAATVFNDTSLYAFWQADDNIVRYSPYGFTVPTHALSVDRNIFPKL